MTKFSTADSEAKGHGRFKSKQQGGALARPASLFTLFWPTALGIPISSPADPDGRSLLVQKPCAEINPIQDKKSVNLHPMS